MSLSSDRQRLIERYRAAPEAFWSRCDVRSEAECWLWLGPRMPGGYGHLGGGRAYAHRLAWLLTHDGEIPRGVGVLHHCDNPPCVNPAHLFLGRQSQNVADMMHKGRQRRGAPHDPLTLERVEFARRILGRFSYKDVAFLLNVHPLTLHGAVVRGRLPWHEKMRGEAC